MKRALFFPDDIRPGWAYKLQNHHRGKPIL